MNQKIDIEWDSEEAHMAIILLFQTGKLKNLIPDHSKKPQVEVLDKSTGEIKTILPFVPKKKGFVELLGGKTFEVNGSNSNYCS